MLLISGEKIDIILKKRGAQNRNWVIKIHKASGEKVGALNEMKGPKNLGYKIHRSGKP